MPFLVSFLPSLFVRLNFRRFFRRTFRSWRFYKIRIQRAWWDLSVRGSAGDREHRAAPRPRTCPPPGATFHLNCYFHMCISLLLLHWSVAQSSLLVSITRRGAPWWTVRCTTFFLFFQRRRLLRNTNPRLVSVASDPPEHWPTSKYPSVVIRETVKSVIKSAGVTVWSKRDKYGFKQSSVPSSVFHVSPQNVDVFWIRVYSNIKLSRCCLRIMNLDSNSHTGSN